ncbi:MAG: glycosyltransferase family 4 protein [Chloroflexi bacterium]|nr:glycosyltransferase family 4 protein [Chloroflexota bacterium]
MRIAMVGPFGLHPNKTMRSRAFSLARELVKRGHAAQLFMPPWQTPQEADKSWLEEDVAMRYTPLRGGVPGITRRLVWETLAWEPDVVHFFKPKAYSGLAAWYLWRFHRRRLRLVMDTDDWEGWGGWNELAPYSPLQKQVFAWQERWGMRRNHALTVASRALETIALSMGIPPEQVVYAPNGPGISYQVSVNSNQALVSSLQSPVLLVYSRLFEFDTRRLVAVLRGVKTAVPDLTILMVGAGLYEEDAAQFRRQLAAAELTESVQDAGWVEQDKLPALLQKADVGVYLMEDTLLNRAKCPVKLADMAAMGLPVVAEAVGQVEEYVVNGRTGLLRPSGDVAGLTADLIHLLQNPAEREQMAVAARDHMAANFSWARLAERMEAVYGRQK